ncbi:hypothetical protein H0H87_003249, partial [Tephrocybe sp. NHM501043]
PELLNGLRTRSAQAHSRSVPANETGTLPESKYIAHDDASRAAAKQLFSEDLAKEGIAVDKVPEGLAKFSLDAKNLEELVRGKIKAAIF